MSVIVIIIFILAFIDIVFKKDLKSQIVSLGVLGTFIGIFMGLQNFNPSDMKNSIDGILIGLKTAFLPLLQVWVLLFCYPYFKDCLTKIWMMLKIKRKFCWKYQPN